MLGFVVAITVTTVFGRVINVTVIQVDENGHLIIADNPGPPGVLGVDPISGSPALVYSLPFAGNPGDLLLFATNEPPQTSQLSDIVRFEGDGNMYFFSLQHGSNDTDLADVPVLPPPITPNAVVNETGLGGLNHANWTPFTTGIGGDPTNPSIIYLFTSEIPEPGTVILVGLGLATLLAIGRRGQRLIWSNRKDVRSDCESDLVRPSLPYSASSSPRTTKSWLKDDGSRAGWRQETQSVGHASPTAQSCGEGRGLGVTRDLVPRKSGLKSKFIPVPAA